MEASPRQAATHNPVLRYLAILKAARDFGLTDVQVTAVAGRFDPLRPRCEELAAALAELILSEQDSIGRLSLGLG